MGNTKNNSKLCKIVYFDQESITDYIQILNAGQLEKTAELFNNTKDSADGSASLNGTLGMAGIFKMLSGNELTTNVSADIAADYTNERMMKTIVKNTILTDFIDIITQNDNKAIKSFQNYKIDAPKESLAYVALISPYLSMLEGVDISAGEYNIATDKIDNTIKSAKGYYEFLGIKTDEDNSNNEKNVIFRFNMNSFRNNYKATDLLKMNLSVYAIKVGQSTRNMLSFSSEFNMNNTMVDNPSYEENTVTNDSNRENSDNEKLSVYDVLLAGVECND